MPLTIDVFRFFAAARTMTGSAAGNMAGHTSMIRRDPVGLSRPSRRGIIP